MPQSTDDQFALVLGQRQLVAVCSMCLVVIGLVSTLAYVAGRSITAAQMRAQETSEPAPAIVVDPVRSSPAPDPMEAHAQVIVPTPMARPSAPLAVLTAAADSREPLPGQMFWQVGVVDRGIAAVFVEHLIRQGFRARVAAGQSANLQRVLVGPITDTADMEKTKRGLDTAGFQAFQKKY